MEVRELCIGTFSGGEHFINKSLSYLYLVSVSLCLASSNEETREELERGSQSDRHKDGVAVQGLLHKFQAETQPGPDHRRSDKRKGINRHLPPLFLPSLCLDLSVKTNSILSVFSNDSQKRDGGQG